jgi:hypothetical protein|tara:strand:+ start:1948 stop:2301 length:354 start_codon:yes stop_codon:yes gene_type:complete
MVADVNDAGRGPQGGGGKMRCPVCDVPLSMADRQGVEIDFCPDCRGVWLDRGELDKIIERSAADVAPQRAPEPAEPRGYAEERGYGGGYGKHGGGHHGSGYGKHGRRRKSWLSEIFD